MEEMTNKYLIPQKCQIFHRNGSKTVTGERKIAQHPPAPRKGREKKNFAWTFFNRKRKY